MKKCVGQTAARDDGYHRSAGFQQVHGPASNRRCRFGGIAGSVSPNVSARPSQQSSRGSWARRRDAQPRVAFATCGGRQRNRTVVSSALQMDVQTVTPENEARDYREAVVIGAGPAGLAASIMLAKLGWDKVVVLERQSEVGAYEPSLGFVYSIDGRGQEALGELSSEILQDLHDNSVKTPIGDLVINVMSPDGELKPIKPGIGDKDIPNYWLPRHQFVRILYQQVLENWAGTIEVRCGVHCDIQLNGDAAGVSIDVRDACDENDGISSTLRPDLVVGADGINSIVRKALVANEGEDAFGTNYLDSGSAGMQFKVLNLPGKFKLMSDISGGESCQQDSLAHEFYSYVGAKKDDLSSLRLGILPVHAEDGSSVPRTANIIRRPEHKVWSIDNGEEMLEYLEESFPQMPVREVISVQEAERFAKAKPGRFPTPQHCRSLQKVFPAAEEGMVQGVALIGDAAHAFPPDLGQGVNSGLQDVNALAKKLREHNNDIGKALPSFEDARLPEVKALIQIMKLGYPWQYYQDQMRQKLWMLNFAFRMLLNKVAPAIFSPQISGMIMTPSLTYTEILQRAQRTTMAIWTSLLAVVCLIFALVIR